MRLSSLPSALLALFFSSATVTAHSLLEPPSFGHKTPISPNGRGMPGLHLTGSNHQIQLMSDRIILTPPVPGNTRGALWTDDPVQQQPWTAELEFRASGQEGASGNLQLWFTASQGAMLDSIYTIDEFDGLALVIDQYGGRGGGVRGFLNDGTVNFKGHSNLDGLAFGHCDYTYRNLGRTSKVRVSTRDGFAVHVDDRLCFSTDKVQLPPGYHFGVSAGTAENPDSFEIHKFTIDTGATPQPESNNQIRRGPPPPAQKPQQQQQQQPLSEHGHLPSAPEALPDNAADAIQSSSEQFADLHNRLQGLTHQLANVFGEFDALSRKLDARHGEMLAAIPPAQPTDKLDALTRKLESVERAVEQTRKDVAGKDYKGEFQRLDKAIEGVRGGLSEHLPDTIGKLISTSAPRLDLFLGGVVAVQVLLAAAYIVYKRRRNSMPKKYL